MTLKEYLSTLPPEVTAYAKKRRTKKYIHIVGVFVLMVLLSVYAIICAEWYIKTTGLTGSIVRFRLQYVIYIILVALPFGVSGFPRKIKDNSFVGTVKKSVPGERPSLISPRDKLLRIKTVVLDVEAVTHKGFMPKRYTEKTSKYLYASKDCRPGEIILFIDGNEHLFVYPTEGSLRRSCIWCGVAQSTELDECDLCGMPMIKESADDIVRKLDM